MLCIILFVRLAEFFYLPAAGKFYKVIQQPSDWNTAVSLCHQFGPFSHLTSIETNAEMQALRTYFLNNNCE
jgi:hypothetical protein